jgi:hypothetical protein
MKFNRLARRQRLQEGVYLTRIGLFETTFFALQQTFNRIFPGLFG